MIISRHSAFNEVELTFIIKDLLKSKLKVFKDVFHPIVKFGNELLKHIVG